MSVFVCPRCGIECEQRFYGPCEGCRAQLREIVSLPKTVKREWFVVGSRGAGQAEQHSVDYIGPRVDDVSFIGRERREAAAKGES